MSLEERLAADKTAPVLPGAAAEESKTEAKTAEADLSKEAAPGKPLTTPAAAAAPSVAAAPSPTQGFANGSQAARAVQGESKKEMTAFRAVTREVRIPTSNPMVVWRVGPTGALERSENGGAAWQVQIKKPAAALLAGSAPSTTVCWVVGRAGVVLRTTDGEHWTRFSFPFAVDLVGVKAADGAHATVTAADGRAFATADGGETWQPVP
jgi:photosystem II stability/assembly factor-like uncharacterized protein